MKEKTTRTLIICLIFCFFILVVSIVMYPAYESWKQCKEAGYNVWYGETEDGIICKRENIVAGKLVEEYKEFKKQ